MPLRLALGTSEMPRLQCDLSVLDNVQAAFSFLPHGPALEATTN